MDAAIVKIATVDPEAHDLYLQGRFFWNQRTPESLRIAVRYLERANSEDSAYADAYAALADAYVLFPTYAVAAPSESYPGAKAAAARALALDSTLGYAHATLGLIQQSEWDWRGAEQSFRRAIAIDPSYATAHQWYAEYLSALGRHREALAEADTAVALDPLSSIIRTDKGGDLVRARRYDAAIAVLRAAIDVDPGFAALHNYLGWAYSAKGMYAEAVAESDTTARLSRRRLGMGRLAYTYALSGKRDSALQIIRELSDRSRHEYVPSFQFVMAYTGLGDRVQAFRWLNKAVDMREPFPGSAMLTDPLLDSLRSDPQYGRLLARMGLK
jgi:tetratricopeptide (TPR) repeat protein